MSNMEFSKKMGVSIETTRSWAQARSTPQFRHLLKLKRLTKGEIDERAFPPTHSRRKVEKT